MTIGVFKVGLGALVLPSPPISPQNYFRLSKSRNMSRKYKFTLNDFFKACVDYNIFSMLLNGFLANICLKLS